MQTRTEYLSQLSQLDQMVKQRIFANPADKRTEDYISGRFG